MATTKLTDTHLVILSNAAQQPGGRVLPAPQSIGNKGGSTTRALKGLLRRELIAEVAAGTDDTEWSRNGNGERVTLAITEAGLAAIGVESDACSARDAAKPVKTVKSSGGQQKPGADEHATGSSPRAAFRAGTKGAAIVGLLRHKDGATLPDMIEASGWQAHSVRGFLSGTLKKKHGLMVESETGQDGLRRYRIAA